LDIFDFEIKKSWKDRVKYLPHYWRRRITDFYYNGKYRIQRLFRGYSDVDIFSFYSEISRVTLPRLIQYRNKLNGFPGIFSEYNENEWKNREDYEKAIDEKRILGGGSETWEKILDKMIFSFTHILVEDSMGGTKLEKKLVKEYIEKYGDVRAETDDNLKNHSYHYFENPNPKHDMDTASVYVPEEDFNNELVEKYKKDGLVYKGLKKRTYYHNEKLEKELNDKCDEGLMLFGKYFRNLWD